MQNSSIVTPSHDNIYNAAAGYYEWSQMQEMAGAFEINHCHL
jgi:hypothetical protein